VINSSAKKRRLRQLSSEYTLSFEIPDPEEYNRLRKEAGWDPVDTSLSKKALANSLYSVVIRKEEMLIGMGRVVGDGALFFYIQDLVVAPDYQEQGLGEVLMQNIENYLHKTAQKGATIGLLAAKGKEPFYARFGYVSRTGDNLGLGMCKFV
jgi:GNAT superfamily N-acetyltransferase